MRVIGLLLIASVALAALKIAVQIVVVVTVAAAIWYGVTRPAQTFACLVMFVFTGLLAQYPMAALVILGTLALAGLRGRNSVNPVAPKNI